MDKNLKYFSRFNLHGYTINPIKDIQWLSNMLCGLFTYSDNHLCDYGRGKMHLNYLGKQIGLPYIVKIEEPGNEGFIATQYMTNGYFVMKILDSVYPAEIRFDLFLTEPLVDAELLIDHLCAPAIPFDGPGVFDYTYSLTHENAPFHHLNKSDRSKSSYYINEPMLKNESGEVWSITLNELNSIKCHFCEKNAVRWIIIGAPWEPLNSGESRDINLPEFKTVTVCDNHLGEGRYREKNSDKKEDFWTNLENLHDLKYDKDQTNKNYSYNEAFKLNEGIIES
jgi:hypothetical protein